jgi:Ca2+-binding RTX toxin-like protein
MINKCKTMLDHLSHAIPNSKRKEARRRFRRAMQLEQLGRRELMAADLAVTFNPDNGLLNIEGTAGDDSVYIYQANDELLVWGLPIENLRTGESVDSLASQQVSRIEFSGLEGDDFFHFDDTQAGTDRIISVLVQGGDGADTLTTGRGADTIYGGAGDESIAGGPGSDFILGGPGYDTLYGEAGIDFIYGEEDADTIFGGEGDDFIAGGGSWDTMYGEGGNDRIYGNDGDDALYGGLGTDDLWGGAGVDHFEGGDGTDTLWGEAGDDWLYGDQGHDRIHGGDGIDFLAGGDGDDFLAGDHGDDTLLGGLGNDVLQGGAGADTLNEVFGGVDTLDYSEADIGVWVNLATNQVFRGNAEGDMLSGQFERVQGSQGHDTLVGNSKSNRIYGNGGNDTIDGGAGNDYLYGGNNNDLILGGGGDDELWGESGNDQLNGQSGSDRMYGGAGRDTLIAIDSAYADYVDGQEDFDIVWADIRLSIFAAGASDQIAAVNGGDAIQKVAGFANGADRTLDGDRIDDPATYQAGVDRIRPYQSFMGNPLFSVLGPSLTDIRQGEAGDCYALAGLGAVVQQDPNVIRSHVVDFNDGTYGVKLGDRFYRVDNDLPVLDWGSNTLAFAKLGFQNSMWVPIMEKAFTHFRSGANSYESIGGGSSVELKHALGLTNIGNRSFSYKADKASLANDLLTRFRNGDCITFDFTGSILWGANIPLIRNHSYVLNNLVLNDFGHIQSVKLYNPWGFDGLGRDETGHDGTDDGFVTLTLDQLFNQNGVMNWGHIA